MSGNDEKTGKQSEILPILDAANAFYATIEAKKSVGYISGNRPTTKNLATRVVNALKNLAQREGLDIPKDLITIGSAALKVKKNLGVGSVVLIGEVLADMGYIKSAYDWSVPAGQRATPRYEILVAAMSGWTGYGYKNGEYIADMQAFFDKALDQARLGLRNGKPYLYEYLSEVEDIENAGL